MKYLFICIFLLGMGLMVKPKTTSPYQPKKHIFLLLGQSNMSGRGVITDEYKNLKYDRVFMLNRDSRWVEAKHPIHFDKPKVVGVGPGLSFGAAMAAAYPNDTIYLVPCAVGGTSIDKWQPGAYDKASNTYPYDDALLRIKAAVKKGKISGAIWLQGESDSKPKSAAIYLDKLVELIQRLRVETGNEKLPFVAGELGRYRKRYELINDQLQLLPSKLPYTEIVNSEKLTHKGDTTHFDSFSATEYGHRFAKGMLKIMK